MTLMAAVQIQLSAGARYVVLIFDNEKNGAAATNKTTFRIMTLGVKPSA
jgi:hypothetical protein